jgi:hypothetical protein
MGIDFLRVDRRRDDYIRVDLSEIWHQDVDWICMTCDSVLLQASVNVVKYKHGCFLGCCAVLSGRSLALFQRGLLFPSSGH